jgi:hypothetical protein
MEFRQLTEFDGIRVWQGYNTDIIYRQGQNIRTNMHFAIGGK